MCTKPTTVPAFRAGTILSTSTKMPHALLVALLVAAAVVHCATTISVGLSSEVLAAERSKAKSALKSAPASTTLTPAAAEMRDAILDAVGSGQLEDLHHAIELNELKPDFAAPPGTDPISHLRTLSRDATGADLLQILDVLLASTPAIETTGKDVENNRIFLWPAFAIRPIQSSNPDDTALLARLAKPEDAAAILTSGQYGGWQLRIGADGVWHSFKIVR